MTFVTLRLPLENVVSNLWILPHLFALVLLPLLCGRLGWNLRFLRWVRSQAARPITQFPRVSVLVPARNEAASITSCVTSLLQQDYPDMEIIVLDDGSTDGTSQQLDVLSASHPHLTVIHTTDDPPLGWTGKNYACHRLAEQSTGEWLLFTDADTIHAPRSVLEGVTLATRLDTALLSAFPHQRTGTWAERIMVSFIIDFFPLIGLNFAAVWRGRARRTAANGQYVLVNAAAYRAIRGHASIRDALIDDFALAQRLRSFGYTVALVDGTAMLSCRMYHTFGEVWNGFSKNLLGALTASAQRMPTRTSGRMVILGWASLFAWCYACLFVIPFVNLVFSAHHGLAVIETCGLYLLRGIAVWHLRRPLHEVLTTPLAAWGVMALGLGALSRRVSNQPIAWKGRLYKG